MKGVWLAGAVIYALVAGCATAVPPSQMYKNQPKQRPEPGKALVTVFYAFNPEYLVKITLNTPVLIKTGGCNGMPIGSLVNHSYLTFNAAPGAYMFGAEFNDGHGNCIPFQTALRAGQSYYLQVFQTAGVFVPDLSIDTASEADAEYILPDFRNCTLSNC